MNITIRILSVVLSVSLIFSLVSCGKSSGGDTAASGSEQVIAEELIEATFDPLYAGTPREHSSNIVGAIAGNSTDILLYDNPDRGYRTTTPLNINPAHPDPEDPTKTSDTCDLIIRDEKTGRVRYNSKSKCSGKHDVRWTYGNLDNETNQRAIDYMFQLVYIRTEKTDYYSKLLLLQACFYQCGTKEVLPDYIFRILELYFDTCREYGIRIIYRHGYHGVQKNWQVSEANRQEHLKFGATEEIMIAHTKQLGPFLGKHKDIIHKLSSGFIGSGGEMAYNYQYPVVDYDNVIKAIVENICVPNGFYFTVRMPRYKQSLLYNDPDYEYAHLIGHNNDAMYGENENYGWASECYQINHNFETTRGEHKCVEADNYGEHIPNDMWEYVMETGAYTPQSGEMFHMSSTSNINRFITGYDMIKMVAHHRYTTMSQWNSFIETSYDYAEMDGKTVVKCNDSVMQRWINNEIITPDWLDENNIIYDPAWFYDKDGNEVLRNPYEFIRDHLGYRIQAACLKIQGNTVTVSLKNYGFAAAFCMHSGFAILDEDYNLVSEVAAGNPETWYSHDPDNWESNELLMHEVSAEINLPDDGKKYYIAFYLKNDMNEYARFANDPESVPFEGAGYNILYTIN